MSADNFIAVAPSGRWWKVWMDFASNEDPKPEPRCAKFLTRLEALEFAHDWARREHTEYGVHELE